jgi:glutathione synthase/RimK-type ligase-like ATP-grasp enzyme
MKNILKTILRTWFTILTIQFSKIRKRVKKDADIVVLVYPNFPKDIFRYFYSDAFVNDTALLNAVANNFQNFRIKIGIKKSESIKNSSVFLNVSNRYNLNGLVNYCEALTSYINKLLQNNNVVYPSINDVLYWENKKYMHEQFESLHIKSPKTTIISTSTSHQPPQANSYPFLIKEVHSAGSLGVYKIETEKDYYQIISNPSICKRNEHLLVQELLHMDRDLRVIIIGSEIVLHYWRINKSKEWKPTSTKHGSDVDFDFFPNEWRQHIIEEFKKLNITTGAFDLVWVNNNYKQAPYVLEVSPSYQPNPKPPLNLNTSYGNYKSGFRFIDSWDKRFITIVNQLKNKLVVTNLKNSIHKR